MNAEVQALINHAGCLKCLTGGELNYLYKYAAVVWSGVVEPMTPAALLQESGDYLLLEDSGKILLE